MSGDGEAVYAWHIVVRRWSLYGDRIISATPALFRAATRAEVTAKMRVAFGATHDDFRKFWSHDWTLTEMREIDRADSLTASGELGGER